MLKACRRQHQTHHGDMDRATASQQIREHCNVVSTAIMKVHPLLNALGDDATKGEIVKALFEITRNVEVVKKQVMKLEKRDDSSLL
jgi:hypothetical protein